MEELEVFPQLKDLEIKSSRRVLFDVQGMQIQYFLWLNAILISSHSFMLSYFLF